jgi:hypothetical protein
MKNQLYYQISTVEKIESDFFEISLLIKEKFKEYRESIHYTYHLLSIDTPLDMFIYMGTCDIIDKSIDAYVNDTVKNFNALEYIGISNVEYNRITNNIAKLLFLQRRDDSIPFRLRNYQLTNNIPYVSRISETKFKNSMKYFFIIMLSDNDYHKLLNTHYNTSDDSYMFELHRYLKQLERGNRNG